MEDEKFVEYKMFVFKPISLQEIIDFDLILEDGESFSGNFTGDIHIWSDIIEDWI